MSYTYKYNYRKGTTFKRAGRTMIPVNKAIPGDWNVIDDRTGFKIKGSQSQVTWEGLLVSDDISEPRTPQDFVRAVKDQQPIPPRMTRVETAPQFSSTTEEDLINSLLLRK